MTDIYLHIVARMADYMDTHLQGELQLSKGKIWLLQADQRELHNTTHATSQRILWSPACCHGLRWLVRC